jgi:hypothetical protein
VSSENRRTSGLFFPIKIRPDIGTALAARLADKLRFDIGQADMIGPLLASTSAEPGPMAALIVRAIDQDAANVGRAQFAEGDFGSDDASAARCGRSSSSTRA